MRENADDVLTFELIVCQFTVPLKVTTQNWKCLTQICHVVRLEDASHIFYYLRDKKKKLRFRQQLVKITNK